MISVWVSDGQYLVDPNPNSGIPINQYLNMQSCRDDVWQRISKGKWRIYGTTVGLNLYHISEWEDLLPVDGIPGAPYLFEGSSNELYEIFCAHLNMIGSA